MEAVVDGSPLSIEAFSSWRLPVDGGLLLNRQGLLLMEAFCQWRPFFDGGPLSMEAFC